MVVVAGGSVCPCDVVLSKPAFLCCLNTSYQGAGVGEVAGLECVVYALRPPSKQMLLCYSLVVSRKSLVSEFPAQACVLA